MIKIGVYSDKFDSVRDFYRGIGVLSRLPNVLIEKINFDDLLAFKTYDVIFLSSPVNSPNLNLIQYAKYQKIPIWTDFDDFIPDVQSDNIAYDVGIEPQLIQQIYASIRESDIVTVSTEHLKKLLEPHNKNVHVVPNAFNDYCFKLEYNLSKSNTVGWRGAIAAHGRDLMTQLDAFIKLDQEFDRNGWKFSFHGKNPWYLTDHLKNWVRTPELPFFQFMESFKQSSPAVFVYPLVECDFNLSKSQLAWMDATYAGAACVMPSFGIFGTLPVFDFTDDFYDKAVLLIESADQRKRLYEMSLNKINSTYLLSNVNEKRKEILETIL